MPQGSGNWAEVGQNHDAPKVVSATLSVLKWSGAIFRARSPKVSVQNVLLCPFHCKPRPSGVSLESPGLKNIAQVPGNRAEVGQNHGALKAVSATPSVLKWSGDIFRPRSSKVSVQKVLLCPFLCKPRPWGVIWEAPGRETILQVFGNQAEVGQNHVAAKAVLATLSVLKWSGVIFRPRSSKVSVEKFLLGPFLCKPKPSEVSLEFLGLENIPQVLGNLSKVGLNNAARKAV